MNRFKGEVHMTDAELIDMLQKTPDRGIERLMDEYMGLVCHVVKGRLSGVYSKEDMEDCVSDVFCDFYYKADSIDLSLGTVKAYLCSMARYKAINLYKAKVRESGSVPIDSKYAQDTYSEDFSVEDEYLTEELRHELMHEIRRLGRPDHEIIVRKFFFNEPSKAIARRLNMTVSAVDTRTHRALKKLKERLGGLMK